jgi:protein gp37
MADRTNIEWCDATFNPFIGCTKISPGCDNCYAAAQDKFRSWTPEGWGGPRKRTSEANWRKPLRWNDAGYRACAECGWRGEWKASFVDSAYGGDHICPACTSMLVRPARRRVFCASLADVFDNQVPVQWRRDLFDLIELTPNLDWLLLTKRIGNVADMVREARTWDWLLGRSNVWLGATVVNQEEADRDIPKLLATPARVRFLSLEPLLGPITLAGRWSELKNPKPANATHPCDHLNFVDWVIAGGESGPGARPAHPDWFRSLRDQCAAADVPFLFKQHGEWNESIESDLSCWVAIDGRGVIEHGTDAEARAFAGETGTQWRLVYRPGKKAAGRLLDGREHNEFPSPN